MEHLALNTRQGKDGQLDNHDAQPPEQ